MYYVHWVGGRVNPKLIDANLYVILKVIFYLGEGWRHQSASHDGEGRDQKEGCRTESGMRHVRLRTW